MPIGIRPTPNLVRKAMFDVFGQDLQGVEFLELFAGSGAVGIEALSCGAQRVTFVENDPANILVIEDNLKLLGLDPMAPPGPILGKSEVIHGDTFYAIKKFAKINRKILNVNFRLLYHNFLFRNRARITIATMFIESTRRIKTRAVPYWTESFTLGT